MEHGIGPAFDKASGDAFRTLPAGSSELANQIKGKLPPRRRIRQRPNPKVNDGLIGAANGDW